MTERAAATSLLTDSNRTRSWLQFLNGRVQGDSVLHTRAWKDDMRDSRQRPGCLLISRKPRTVRLNKLGNNLSTGFEIRRINNVGANHVELVIKAMGPEGFRHW